MAHKAGKKRTKCKGKGIKPARRIKRRDAPVLLDKIITPIN